MTKETNSLIERLHRAAELDCICVKPVEGEHHHSCSAPFSIATANRIKALSTECEALREALSFAVSWIEDLQRKNASHQLAEYKLDELRNTLQQTNKESGPLPEYDSETGERSGA